MCHKYLSRSRLTALSQVQGDALRWEGVLASPDNDATTFNHSFTSGRGRCRALARVGTDTADSCVMSSARAGHTARRERGHRLASPRLARRAGAEGAGGGGAAVLQQSRRRHYCELWECGPQSGGIRRIPPDFRRHRYVIVK